MRYMASRNSYTTSDIPTRGMGEAVDEMMNAAEGTRKGHERRWYDNNFFDDGYHFRYVSREENKIVDWSEKTSIYNPLRAIPKASKQVRGIVNLLVSQEYVPVTFPERVEKANYENPVEYEAAKAEAKIVARRNGHFIEEEFKKQGIKEKLAFMGILAAKNSVSYLKVWPDTINEKINTTVKDAFDIYLMGELSELEDEPFIVEATPRRVSEIKADEQFDREQITKLTPDNRFASSEIKEAYMTSRYGGHSRSDNSATLIQKQAFIKEYINKENLKAIRKQENAGDILESRGEGDPVIRQVFSAGGVWLRDEYLDMNDYPYVDFRYEPGPIYQVPMIERFIPQNKSLDMIVSRTERHAHTMGVGVWLKRQGEQFNINNKAGGQIIEYQNVPPKQMELAPLPTSFFNYMGILNSFIEEQGVTLTTTGKVPSGVKSGIAIEALKESEYANLVIANARLKQTVKRIAEKFMDIADNTFVTPQTYTLLEKGEPTYFDIIGKRAIKKRESVHLETPEDVIPVSRDYHVDIEVQSGLGYTREGKKAAAKELGDYLIQLANVGAVPPNVITSYIERLFEIYQFGGGSEISRDIEKFNEEGQLTDQQMEKIKVAMAEVIRDAGLTPGPTPDERIEEGKVATAEAIKDTGIADKQEPQRDKGPNRSISFKDLPPEGRVQLAEQAGIEITPQQVKQQESQQIKQTSNAKRT